MSQEIIEKLKQAIEGYKDSPEWEEIGKVIEVGDGIVKISGLSNAQSQEVLVIEIESRKNAESHAEIRGNKVMAVTLNLEEDAIGALVLGVTYIIKAGQRIKNTKKLLSFPVGKQLWGRVVDFLVFFTVCPALI